MKGISPLMASIILIAFTVGLAVLLYEYVIKPAMSSIEWKEPEDLIDMDCEELEQELRKTNIVSWRTEIIAIMILKECEV